MLAQPGATLGCNVTLSVCVDVVLGTPVSDVEVNISRMVRIGLGQSAAARSPAEGWQMGSALLGDFLRCGVEAFNSKCGCPYHRIA